uniref:Uncharacterized protein n=1 Tax=Borely moumouvirus TaxID=2712067 RepID=A0A6G6ACF9_9VIRU
MNMLGEFISQDPDHNFLHYLNYGDNGSKYNLTNELIALEKLWDIPSGNMYLFTKMYENRIWEIPTNELCEGLIRIFDLLKIKKINELAAGNGLLSARLKYYAEKLNNEIKISTSDGTNKIFGNHPFTYTKVKDLNIRCFNKSEPIIISWIHCQFEDELLSVVKKFKNDYIFLIGEEPDEDYGNNQSDIFEKEIFSYGYSKITFEFQQISQMDYYLHDFIRKDIYNENKTCVTLYFHQSKISDIWFVKSLLTKNHPQLFGKYLGKSKEYYSQDKNLIDISNKKIDEYVSNDYYGLNPLLAKGLKNFMDNKKRQEISRSLLEYSSSQTSSLVLNSNKRIKMIQTMTLAFMMSDLMEKLMESVFKHEHEFYPVAPKYDITQIVGRINRTDKELEDTTPQVMDKLSNRSGNKGVIGWKRPFLSPSVSATAFPTIKNDSLSTHCDFAIEIFNSMLKNQDPYSNPLDILQDKFLTNKYMKYELECELGLGKTYIVPTYVKHTYFSIEREYTDKPFGPTISDLISRNNYVVLKKFVNKSNLLMNNKKILAKKKKFVYKQPKTKSRNH